MAALGWGATQSAQANAFSRHQRGKATNTLKTHYRALQLWAQFLNNSAENRRMTLHFRPKRSSPNRQGGGV
ncbi:MAG: hypothetical protein M9918_22300 [Anaerolineae bacterium]|nr:hypothetical protein [Anaerolineae bacterium]